MKNVFIIISVTLCILIMSTSVKADWFSLADLASDSQENKYYFSISGQIRGISGNSPLSWIISNGDAYSVSGNIYMNGALEVTYFKIMSDPASGGSDSIVATPDSATDGPSSVTTLTTAAAGENG